MIPIRVNSPINPYRDHVQGKSNEPITVAALLDRAAFQATGTPRPYEGDLATHRAGIAGERRAQLLARARQIAPSNRMLYPTEAARGVVPLPVAEAATEGWLEPQATPVYNRDTTPIPATRS